VFPLALLAVFALGVSPCDLLGGGEAEELPASCSGEACEYLLIVGVIRSDNDGFLAGSYRFALYLPDESQYSIDCYLAHAEAEFECTLGDTDVISAWNEELGQRIRLEIAGAPISLNVSVEYNGLSIGERTLVPEYVEYYPEGEQCPACYVGEETMAVLPW
jgi:hypothetical protein